MVDLPKELEIERLNSLATGFGWERVREETKGEYLELVFRKRFKDLEPPEDVVEGAV